jgi:hypothetical protein
VERRIKQTRSIIAIVGEQIWISVRDGVACDLLGGFGAGEFLDRHSPSLKNALERFGANASVFNQE